MKFSKVIKMILYLLFISAFLVSCNNDESTDKKVIEKTEKMDSEINYKSYEKKIWVCEKSEKEDTNEELFLYITKVDGQNLEGEIFTSSMSVSSYYHYNPPFNSGYPWNLMGIRVGNSAECVLSNKEVDVNVSLVFNDASIVGSITYTDDVALDDKSINEGTYNFKSFTITDVILNYEENGISTTMLNDYSFEIDTDSWGKVYLLSVLVNSNKPHPLFFIVNEENEILYQLNAPFQNGLDITELSYEDINDDALKDVIIILEGVVAWVFFQADDGLFYVDGDVQKDMNIEFFDTTNLNTLLLKEYFSNK